MYKHSFFGGIQDNPKSVSCSLICFGSTLLYDEHLTNFFSCLNKKKILFYLLIY